MIRPALDGDQYALRRFVWNERGDDDLNLYPRETDNLATLLLGAHCRSDRALVALNVVGEVVGIAAVTRGHPGSSRHTALLRLHVAEKHRRHGIGAELLDEALNWADERGIKRLVGLPYIERVANRQSLSYGLTPSSAKKLAFFYRAGFELEGYMRHAVRLLGSGHYRDVALLARVTL